MASQVFFIPSLFFWNKLTYFLVMKKSVRVYVRANVYSPYTKSFLIPFSFLFVCVPKFLLIFAHLVFCSSRNRRMRKIKMNLLPLSISLPFLLHSYDHYWKNFFSFLLSTSLPSRFLSYLTWDDVDKRQILSFSNCVEWNPLLPLCVNRLFCVYKLFFPPLFTAFRECKANEKESFEYFT